MCDFKKERDEPVEAGGRLDLVQGIQNEQQVAQDTGVEVISKRVVDVSGATEQKNAHLILVDTFKVNYFQIIQQVFAMSRYGIGS